MLGGSENGAVHLAEAEGDGNGEMAVGAWDSLIDPNYKDRNDGLGSGRLHRTGSNFKPVDEETILRQRYRLPYSERKTQNGYSSSNFNNPNHDTRPKVNPKYAQRSYSSSHQHQPNCEKTKVNSPPPLTPSSSRGVVSESPEMPTWALQQQGQTRPRAAIAPTKQNNLLTNQHSLNPRPRASENNAWSQGNLVSEPFWDKPKQQQETTSSIASTTGNNTQSTNTQRQPYDMTSPMSNPSVEPPQQRFAETTSMNGRTYDPTNYCNQNSDSQGATYNSTVTNYSQVNYDYGTNYNQNGRTHSTDSAIPIVAPHNAHTAGMMLNHQTPSMNYPYNTSQSFLPQYQNPAAPPGHADHTNPAYPYSNVGKLPPGISSAPPFANPVVAKVEVNLGPTIQAHVSIKMYDDSGILAEQLCISHRIYDPMVMKQLQMIFNTQQLAGIKKGLMR